MRARITIADVARAANVSTQTVSRAINNKSEIRPETRRRVLAVAERLGYQPNSLARGLATDRTATIGIVAPDIANPFFVEIIRGAEDVALEHGYNIFLCNTIENPQREAALLSLLEQKRVDGVILCSSSLSDDELQLLLVRQRAVALVSRPPVAGAAGAVRSDDEIGMRMAVEHLVACGRRRIGFLGRLGNTYGRHTRYACYVKNLAAHGLEFSPNYVDSCMPYLDEGRIAAQRLLCQYREIDGLVCHNDLIALGVLQACRELDIRVPDDIAIIGFDDIPFAALVTPSLTTLRVRSSQLGRCAAEMIFATLAGKEGENEAIFAPELVIRHSTVKCNDNLAQNGCAENGVAPHA